MPRQKRADAAGVIYHALNRGNARQRIFRKDEDYDAFIQVVGEGLQKYDVELFSFTLMPNHWHLVVRPGKDGELGRMLRWVTATHTLRYHSHNHTRGEGHVYQSRFKSFPIQDDAHFYVVCRYVERNALQAKLVAKAELWKHGSLYRWNLPSEPKPRVLSPWPIMAHRSTTQLDCSRQRSPYCERTQIASHERPAWPTVWRLKMDRRNHQQIQPMVNAPTCRTAKEGPRTAVITPVPFSLPEQMQIRQPLSFR
jgi:putative transposase